MSASEARARVDRVRLAVSQAREDLVSLWREHAWLSLGYASWDELCDAEFGVRMALPREERREVVADLRAEGMSTRAIGSALGIADQTVRADMVRLREITQSDPTPARITSLDGRERPATRPAPANPTPRRKPLLDAFGDAVPALLKAAQRAVNLTEDDRFARNANQVGTKYRADLIRARDALSGVIDSLTSEEG